MICIRQKADLQHYDVIKDIDGHYDFAFTEGLHPNILKGISIGLQFTEGYNWKRYCKAFWQQDFDPKKQGGKDKQWK